MPQYTPEQCPSGQLLGKILLFVGKVLTRVPLQTSGTNVPCASNTKRAMFWGVSGNLKDSCPHLYCQDSSNQVTHPYHRARQMHFWYPEMQARLPGSKVRAHHSKWHLIFYWSALLLKRLIAPGRHYVFGPVKEDTDIIQGRTPLDDLRPLEISVL